MIRANHIGLGDCLELLPQVEPKSVDMVYIDPPFNTGHTQRLRGFDYTDSFEDYEGFLMPRIEACLPAMKPNGSIFVHLDWREVHNIKVLLDKILGKKRFMNEIIWSFDYGARSKRWWPRKHNNILWYVLGDEYTFHYDKMERVPYLAPSLQKDPARVAAGKTLCDHWFQTIVPVRSRERTGLPSQKPVQITDRLIKVHTNPGDTVMDFFCGSGTTGVSAIKHGRKIILFDENPAAYEVTLNRISETKQTGT